MRNLKHGQNAVQFMVITAVILTVVAIVAISAASEFEKTLSLSSVRNTANTFANDNGYLLQKIDTNSGHGYYNFTVQLIRETPTANSDSLKEKVLQKIALVLNQPTPVINNDGCSQIAHYTYCVTINEN